jgi:hypothetical protein
MVRSFRIPLWSEKIWRQLPCRNPDTDNGRLLPYQARKAVEVKHALQGTNELALQWQLTSRTDSLGMIWRLRELIRQCRFGCHEMDGASTAKK